MSAMGQDPGSAPAATQGAPGGATQESGQGAQAPAFDYSRIEEMLDTRFGQMDERVGGLEQRLPQPQEQEHEQEPDPYAQFGEMGYDPQEIQQLQQTLAPLFQQQQAPLMQLIQQQQQTIQQLQQGLGALNNELDAGDLVERYPALGTDEVYTPVAQQALQLAQQMGLQYQHPGEVPASLVEQVYLAQLGRERVASETPAGGGNPGLESAGGASPPEPEPDIAQSIVNARGGQRTAASEFWGFLG